MSILISRKKFFQIIREDKSVHFLKHQDPKELHYLQLIFFKPIMAKVSIILFLSFSLLPLFLIKNPFFLVVVMGLILWTDYKNRNIIKEGLTKDYCIYELLGENEKK